MQTKWQSFIESLVSILIGFGIALISQLILFPFYGIHPTLNTNIQIVLWFTVISLIRTYIIRRVFNRRALNTKPLLPLSQVSSIKFEDARAKAKEQVRGYEDAMAKARKQAGLI